MHKQSVIVRVGPVARIGKPEVLPYHYAVTVASIIKFLVTDLPHPVAYHIEVHLPVISNRDVILAFAIEKIVLAKAPVASKRHETLTVYPHLQFPVSALIRHLSDTCTIICSDLFATIRHKLIACIIHIRLAITVRPPKAHTLFTQLGVFLRSEHHFLFLALCHIHTFLKRYIANPTTQFSRYSTRLIIHKNDTRSDGSCRIGQSQ